MKNIKKVICGLLFCIFSCTNNIELKEGYVTTADGVNLYFYITGTEKDTVVVPSATFLAQEFKKLSGGRTLIFYDPRNRGKSSAVQDSSFLGMKFELSDLESVRKYFRIKTMSLIGWSYLGAVVTLYAADHPEQVNRVIQIGTWPPRKTPYWNEFLMAHKIRMDSLNHQHTRTQTYRELLIKSMMADTSSYTRLSLTHQNSLENETIENMNFTLSQIRKSLGNWDWRVKTSNLLMPVLTIQGEQDPLPIESANEWVKILPNARLLNIPKSGHLPFVERPDVFYPAVENFLNGSWPENSLKLSKK